MIKIDLTGKRFGNLHVLSLGEDVPGKKKKWLCECKCGNRVLVAGSNLRSGHSTMCKQCAVDSMHAAQVTHGESGSKLYGVWRAMLNRCENPKNKSYKDYGAKNICVCAEWHDASSFFDWAKANGYKEGLEIDRINVSENYEPSNCRWISRLQNANNKTNNVYYHHKGKQMTLAEIARCEELNYKALHKQLKQGHTLEAAIKKLKG